MRKKYKVTYNMEKERYIDIVWAEDTNELETMLKAARFGKELEILEEKIIAPNPWLDYKYSI